MTADSSHYWEPVMSEPTAKPSFHYGTGAIFMIASGHEGKAKALWHTPTHAAVGQQPQGGYYITSCGLQIAPDEALILRLPLSIAKMPRRVCKTCTF
jgi:hypothetical protein